MRQAYKLEPILGGAGTRLHFHVVMISPALPHFVRRPMLKMMISRMFLSHCQAVANCIAQEIDTGVRPHAVQAVV